MATIIETKELLQTIVSASLAGVGLTFAFSIAIYGVTRFADLNRAERPLAAALAATVAALAFATCLGAIVVGVVVMTQK